MKLVRFDIKKEVGFLLEHLSKDNWLNVDDIHKIKRVRHLEGDKLGPSLVVACSKRRYFIVRKLYADGEGVYFSYLSVSEHLYKIARKAVVKTI